MPSRVTAAPAATPRHHAQDDEPEHVIDDGRADDDPRLRRAHPAEVGQHPGGDPDRRGGQRGADEDGGRREIAGPGGGVRHVAPVEIARDANGRAMPTRATASAAGPTRNISRRSVSRPISKRSSSTPSSASTWITSACGAVGGHDAEHAAAEQDTPASSSPSTAGWPIRSAASPSSLAPTRMAARVRKKRGDVHAPRPRPGGGGRRARRWRRRGAPRRKARAALRRGAEEEGVLEERKLDTIAVLGLDGDPAAATAIDPEAGCLPENGVGGRR